ncbi:MAG: hypothetical protein ACLQVY_04745 [Limisphaerales bacterium]
MGQVVLFDKDGARAVAPPMHVFPVKDFLNAVDGVGFIGQIFHKEGKELPIGLGDGVGQRVGLL